MGENQTNKICWAKKVLGTMGAAHAARIARQLALLRLGGLLGFDYPAEAFN